MIFKLVRIYIILCSILVISACDGLPAQMDISIQIDSGNTQDNDNDAVPGNQDIDNDGVPNIDDRDDNIYQAQHYDLDAETYEYESLFSVSDAHLTYNEGGRVGTIVATHNDHTYMIYVDTELHPKLAKYSHLTGTLEVQFLAEPTYQMRDDGHHKWTIGIDKEGYIHVAGDMHNYAIVPDSTDHMPVQYQTGRINYWRSNSPEDISSFTWLGGSIGDNTDVQAPQGNGFTYINFISDQQDNLYFYSRVGNNQRGGGFGYQTWRGFNVSQYNAATQSWRSLGADNPYNNNALFWEDNGEDGHGGTYSKIHGYVSFDLNNRMHAVTNILNQDIVTPTGTHFSTDIAYVSSDFGAQNLQKANGDLVYAPLRVDDDGVYDRADVAYTNTNEMLGTQADVVADYLGRPIVMAVDKKYDTNRFVRYENGSWVNYGDIGIGTEYWYSGLGNNSSMDLDRLGVITIVRDGKFLTRMWSVDEQIRTITLPIINDQKLNSLNLDARHLKKTGEIIAVGSRNDTTGLIANPPLQVVRIKINRPAGIHYPEDESMN